MQNSPVISVSKGLDCFAQGRYKRAVGYFDEAIRNGGERFSNKTECNIFAYNACAYSLDFQGAHKYATALGDFGYILGAKGQIALQENRIHDAIDCYRQIETGLLQGKRSLLPIENVYYVLGLLYGYPGELYNSYKCADYLRKCADSNDFSSAMSAYWIYVYWLVNKNEHEGGINSQDMKYNDAYLYLKKAANNNYPPAYFVLATAELLDVKNLDAAVKWLEKAAVSNAKAMALLGKVLVTEPRFSARKQEGVNWLRKSLQGNKLEQDIEDFSRKVPRSVWPETRLGVEECLQRVSPY